MRAAPERGADRTVLKVTNNAEEPEGLERFETFIDCGTLEIVGSDTAMSLEEGKAKLLDYPRTESLTATLPQGARSNTAGTGTWETW